MRTVLSSRPRRPHPGAAPLTTTTLVLGLRQTCRAFALGYAWVVGPRLIAIVVAHLRRLFLARRRPRPSAGPDDPRPLLRSLARVLLRALGLRSFPFFCAVLIGGNSVLELPFRRLLAVVLRLKNHATLIRLSRWLAAFVSAWVGYRLLQTRRRSKGTVDQVAQSPSQRQQDGGPDTKECRRGPKLIGSVTQDLTLFAVTRAVDVVAGLLWTQYYPRRGVWNRCASVTARATDSVLFAMSSAVVMWSFVYNPARLTRTYCRWISAAAAVDGRLLETLVRLRRGSLLYAVESGQAELLGSMCADYGWPPVWGDLARTWPVPCELVHMGSARSCEVHALSRFVRSWAWAMANYLPLCAISLLRRRRYRSAAAYRTAVVSAARSSAFLGAFVALFYYGVCLARTRLGPVLVRLMDPSVPPGSPEACHRLDSGACIATGCALCGWSVLIEPSARRGELMLFVAPRALAALLPHLPRPRLGTDTLQAVSFSACAAVVLTSAREDSRRVRGFMGSLLSSVLKA